MSYDLFEKIEYKNLTNLFNICTKTNLTELVKIEYLKNNQYSPGVIKFPIRAKIIGNKWKFYNT